MQTLHDLMQTALHPYGAKFIDGKIVKTDKPSAVVVTIKGNRLRVASPSGALLFSGPATVKAVESFVERFWYWEKLPNGTL